MRLPKSPASSFEQKPAAISARLFLTLVLLLVIGTVIRSVIATRLDSFTIDKAYHIAAGVSYVRHADFRINPERPPLVRLWRTYLGDGFQRKPCTAIYGQG